MKVLSRFKAGLFAIATLVGVVSVANADDGTIRLRVFKAGFIFGGSAGEGVSNIRRPSDVSGVYAQGGAGAAVGRGAQAIVLTNQNGAVLALSGEQDGLIVSLDLSGLALSLK